MSLAAATRSEVTKQFSTSMWWILAIILVLYVGSMSGGLAAVFGATATGSLSGDPIPLPVEGAPTLLYSFASSFGYVFAVLIGTMMVTGELRHKTLTPTFLAVPRRGKALLAKVLVGALLGVLYGVLALIAAVGAGAGLLAAFGQDAQLSDPEIWALFGRVLLALVLWTIIGIGIGALIRNQIGAIVSVLAFTQLVEPVARLGLSFVKGAERIADYLPGGASDILVGASFLSLGQTNVTSGQEWWFGAIVLAAYAVIFLFLGWLVSWRRDVA